MESDWVDSSLRESEDRLIHGSAGEMLKYYDDFSRLLSDPGVGDANP